MAMNGFMTPSCTALTLIPLGFDIWQLLLLLTEYYGLTKLHKG
jgi:hypothetical protein